jgi:translation initiation factor IF-2
MSDKTVQALAEVVGIPLDRFLEQLKEAGLSATEPDDIISEDEKVQLLAHLRKRHGKAEASQENAAPKRITLKRSTKTELRQSSAPGSGNKTVSVEVRKQKTYIKRSEAVVTDDQREAERARQALATLEEQKRKQQEEEEKRHQQEAQLKAEAEKAQQTSVQTEQPAIETEAPITAPIPEIAPAAPVETTPEPVAAEAPAKPKKTGTDRSRASRAREKATPGSCGRTHRRESPQSSGSKTANPA